MSTQVIIGGIVLVVVACRCRWEGDSGGRVNDRSCCCLGGGGGHAGGCHIVEGGKAVVTAASLTQVVIVIDVGIVAVIVLMEVEGSLSNGGGCVVSAAEWG